MRHSAVVVVFLFVAITSGNAAAVLDSTAERGSVTSAITSLEDSTRLDALKLSIIGGISVGAFVYTNVILTKAWWRDYPEPFHFNNDDDYLYALNADKFGHFYTPYLLTNLYGQAFQWAGVDTTTSFWLGAAIGVSFQTYAEIRDGFSHYGFSWGDFAADVLGAGYPLLQRSVPFLRNFTFKISYYPSEKYRAGQFGFIIDDYESTFDWLSVNVHNLLPEPLQNWYPAWVNIAVGHSVRNLDGLGGGQHELYIGLDWNLDALPDCGWFCNLLKHNFNFYHLPAPAVRILPDVVWYGLKF